MTECAFCSIVDGEERDRVIYEDEHYLGFLSLYPASPGHTLVIPKKHYDRVWDLPEEEIGEYFKVCKKIANHFTQVTGDKRIYSLIFGNEVEHAHIWLIPTFSGNTSYRVAKVIMDLDKPKLLDQEAKELVALLKMR